MLDAEQANRLRDKIEESLAEVMAAAMRRFLARVAKAAGELTADSKLTAAGPPNMTLGQIMGWWTAIVDQALMTKIIDAYSDAVHQHLPDGTQVVATSLDEAAPYFSAVRDRLVQGIVPPLPDDAFNKIRETLAQAAAQGWSRQGLARRIAEELAWEPNKSYWQDELARANAQIDSILDPLGPPGSPVREAYRLNDPTITSLQADRRNAIARIEADESYWETRATRIARTEATGANNYAALRALADEGASHKQWVATEDRRTRPTHVEADGQVVALNQAFLVGGSTLQMPGDPNGPAAEIINCRCTVIGVQDPNKPEKPDPYKQANVDPAAVEGLRLLDGPQHPNDILAEANPFFNDHRQAQINCQKATAAYELRRRGIEATASLGSGGPELATGFSRWFGLKHPMDWPEADLAAGARGRFVEANPKRVCQNVRAKILEQHWDQPGMRGAIVCYWKQGGAHIFNWEISDNGTVLFLDAQTGEVITNTSHYWSNMKAAFVERVDDKTLVAYGKRAFLTPEEVAKGRAKLDAMAKRIAKTRSEIEDLNRQADELINRMNRLEMYSPKWEELNREVRMLQTERTKLWDRLNRQKSNTAAIKEIKK